LREKQLKRSDSFGVRVASCSKSIELIRKSAMMLTRFQQFPRRFGALGIDATSRVGRCATTSRLLSSSAASPFGSTSSSWHSPVISSVMLALGAGVAMTFGMQTVAESEASDGTRGWTGRVDIPNQSTGVEEAKQRDAENVSVIGIYLNRSTSMDKQ
jgi:hypothetical protein